MQRQCGVPVALQYHRTASAMPTAVVTPGQLALAPPSSASGGCDEEEAVLIHGRFKSRAPTGPLCRSPCQVRFGNVLI